MTDLMLTALPALNPPTTMGDVMYIVDSNTSYQITLTNLLSYMLANAVSMTLTPVTTTGLIINPSSGPTGSASEFVGGINIKSGTVGFVTTHQTGDYVTNRVDQATLTNPASGTVPNASSLKIIGAPIASTNVTITNAYSLWVAAGQSLFNGAVVIQPTGNVQSLIVYPSTSPTGSSSTFVSAYPLGGTTVAFATTAQTGSYYGAAFNNSTLTNPSSGTITNATTVYIQGAPVAGSNVTITNNFALWVAAGIALFQGQVNQTITTSSGNATSINVTQTSVNTSDTSDIGLLVAPELLVSSASSQLIYRSQRIYFINALTGGGALSTWRGLEFVYNDNASTTSTEIDYIYIGSGTNSGTRTTIKAINISSLPTATTSYALYNSSAGTIYSSANLLLDGTAIISKYKGIVTTGWGVGAIYGTPTLGTSLNTANTQIATYTPASTGMFRIEVAISCKTTETVTIYITYVDPQAGTITTQQIYSKALTGGTTDSLSFNIWGTTGDAITVYGKGSVALGDAYGSATIEQMQ